MNPISIAYFMAGWVCFIWILNTETKPLSRQELVALQFPLIVLCFLLIAALSTGNPPV